MADLGQAGAIGVAAPDVDSHGLGVPARKHHASITATARLKRTRIGTGSQLGFDSAAGIEDAYNARLLGQELAVVRPGDKGDWIARTDLFQVGVVGFFAGAHIKVADRLAHDAGDGPAIRGDTHRAVVVGVSGDRVQGSVRRVDQSNLVAGEA